MLQNSYQVVILRHFIFICEAGTFLWQLMQKKRQHAAGTLAHGKKPDKMVTVRR